jgi:hypothetical protein
MDFSKGSKPRGKLANHQRSLGDNGPLIPILLSQEMHKAQAKLNSKTYIYRNEGRKA